MEIIPLLLKLLLIGVEVLLNLTARKREKTLIASLIRFDQRLDEFEKRLPKG